MPVVNEEVAKRKKRLEIQSLRFNARFRVSVSVYLLLLGSAVTVSAVYIPRLIGQTTTWSVYISGALGFLCMYLVLQTLFPRWTWDGYGFVLPVKKAVLVTSCDTKLGYYMVKRMDSGIVTIFAGTKNPEGELPRRLSEECTNRLVILPLDVTSEESVTAAMDSMEQTLRKRNHDLWGIVNNCSIAQRSEIEWTHIDTFKQLAEVNVYGMVRVTKAVLPQLRRTKGRIVNIQYMHSNFSGPGSAAYSMTKSAVESFSSALRYEMQQWGIKVCNIEIHRHFKGIDDVINKEELWDRLDEKCQRHYGRLYYDSRNSLWERELRSGDGDLRPIILSVVDGLWSRIPRDRYYVGGLNELLKAIACCAFPTLLTDKLFHSPYPVKPAVLSR